MNISATFHRRALVSAFVLIAATAGNAFAADPAKPQFTDPLKELVGKWHGIHEKVVYAPIWELAFLNGVGPRVQESGLGLISGHAYSAPYEDLSLKGK